MQESGDIKKGEDGTNLPEGQYRLPITPEWGAVSKVWTSEELLAGHQEAIIRHRGETYRLRQTRNGKLMLQK